METGGEAVEVGEQHVVAFAIMPEARVLVLEIAGESVFTPLVQHRVGTKNRIRPVGVNVVQ